MPFPEIRSFSERCFAGITSDHKLEKVGHAISFLPAYSCKALRCISRNLNGTYNELKKGPSINKTDHLVTKIFKVLGEVAAKSYTLALGSIIYVITGAAALALLPLDIVGTLIRCAGMPEKKAYTSHCVAVDASVENVWKYASNSNKARDWSVFFHHITPVPGAVPDGEIGSVRVCYRKKDEKGIKWDETILQKEPNKYRQIHTYNLKGFKIPLANRTEYLVDQFYSKIDDKNATLQFGTQIKPPTTLFNKMILPLTKAGYLFNREELRRVFQVNLENIKAAIEAEHKGIPYVRPHPYEPVSSLD